MSVRLLVEHQHRVLDLQSHENDGTKLVLKKCELEKKKTASFRKKKKLYINSAKNF
jgi:hypothetical protein